jgi:type I restriction enzyme S subunit
MSEWKEIYLTDAYTIDSGLSKPACDFGSGFPFLSFKNVFNNSFVPEKLSKLVESNEKERLTCSIKRGDIFFNKNK